MHRGVRGGVVVGGGLVELERGVVPCEQPSMPILAALRGKPVEASYACAASVG